MKKIITTIAIISSLGIATPILPTFFNVGTSVVEAKSKHNSNKDSKAESRIKRMKSLGIPKSFYKKYGNNISLKEIGLAIGKWIMTVWSQTGQLPSTITTNQPSWLMVKVNGNCTSSADTCSRWVE